MTEIDAPAKGGFWGPVLAASALSLLLCHVVLTCHVLGLVPDRDAIAAELAGRRTSLERARNLVGREEEVAREIEGLVRQRGLLENIVAPTPDDALARLLVRARWAEARVELLGASWSEAAPLGKGLPTCATGRIRLRIEPRHESRAALLRRLQRDALLVWIVGVDIEDSADPASPFVLDVQVFAGVRETPSARTKRKRP